MNQNPFNILASGATAKAGQVFLANEGSVENQFLSEALTQYSVGWTSPDGKLEAMLKALTGEPVIVPKRFGFKKMDNAKAFVAVENDEDVRAIGADFKRVTVQGATVDTHTVSKGLTFRIDRDELNEDPQAEQNAVAYLRTVLYRGEIMRAFSGLSGAATGGNAITATWTAAAKADADAAILAHLETLANDSGLIPNRVWFGSTAKIKRFTTMRARLERGLPRRQPHARPACGSLRRRHGERVQRALPDRQRQGDAPLQQPGAPVQRSDERHQGRPLEHQEVRD